MLSSAGKKREGFPKMPHMSILVDFEKWHATCAASLRGLGAKACEGPNSTQVVEWRVPIHSQFGHSQQSNIELDYSAVTIIWPNATKF